MPLRGLTALAVVNMDEKAGELPSRGASVKNMFFGGLGSSVTPSDYQFLYFCVCLQFAVGQNLIRLRFGTRLASLVYTVFRASVVACQVTGCIC